jgi:hypothetical protein
MRVLLENTKFSPHRIIRIAGIMRITEIIRARALNEEIHKYQTISQAIFTKYFVELKKYL